MKKIFAKIRRLQQNSIKNIRMISGISAFSMICTSFISDARVSPLLNTRTMASFYLETAVFDYVDDTEVEDTIEDIRIGTTTEHGDVPVSTSTTVMGSMFTNSSVMTSTTTSTTSSSVEATTTTTTTSTTGTTATTTSSTTSTTAEPTTTSSSITTTSTTDTTSTTTTTSITTSETEETSATTTTATTVVNDETVYYKPSTHYLHKKSCRWYDNTCQEITSTEDLECRRCTECNTTMEIVKEYVPTTTTTTTTTTTQTVSSGGYASLSKITDTERIYLCNIVGSEYGADWVPLAEKAKVVSTVMNRYYNGGWTAGRPNTIYNVITAPYQYSTAYAVPYYRYNVTQSCIDAVEYYFANEGYYRSLGYTSYWGDGRQNHFR